MSKLTDKEPPIVRTIFLVLALLCLYLGLVGLYTGHVFAVGKHGGDIYVSQQPLKFWLTESFYAVVAVCLFYWILTWRKK
jgi:hypothetical protein